MENLIIIGAGGHAKSVIDSIDETKYNLIGFIDNSKKGMHLKKPILGNSIKAVHNYQDYVYFVAIGDNFHRKKWFNELIELNLKIINIIDKTAIISPTLECGVGNFIGKLAIINTDVHLGDNNIINTKALIEHECSLGSHIHLSTNSTINGNVNVEDEVFLGSTAVCNGQLTIGKNAIIGSGAVIIKNVEPLTTMVGVPAKIIKRRGE